MGLAEALLQKISSEAKDFLRWRTAVEVDITDYNMPDRWRKMQDKTFFGAYSVTTGKRARTIRGAKVEFSMIEALAENDDAEPMELVLGSYSTDREQPNAKYPLHMSAFKEREFEFEIHNIIDFELGAEKIVETIFGQRLQTSPRIAKVLNAVAGLKHKEFRTCLKVTVDVQGAWVKPTTVFEIKFNEARQE